MARRVGDLRPPIPTPPPPPQTQPTQVFRQGLPPLPSSRPLKLTSLEKADLTAVGWKEGDPVPEDMANYLEQARAEANQSLNIPQDFQSLQVPPARNIDQLPAAQRAQVERYLQEAAEQLKAHQYQQAQMAPGAHPSINQAIAAGLQAQQAQQQAAQQAARLAPGDPWFPPEQTTIQPQAPHTVPVFHNVAPAPASLPATSAPQAGGQLPQQRCPHCDWELSRPDPVEVSAEDRLAFLASMKAQQGFRKRYDLLDGCLTVVFREPSSWASDQAWRQVAIDNQQLLISGALLSTDDHWRTHFGYRLALALESVESAELGKIELAPLEEVQIDPASCPAPNTRLHVYYPEVVKQALPTQSLFRTIGAAFRHFEDLVGKCQDNALTPGFWPAIEP